MSRPSWSDKDQFDSYTRMAAKFEREGRVERAQAWRQLRWQQFPNGTIEKKWST